MIVRVRSGLRSRLGNEGIVFVVARWGWGGGGGEGCCWKGGWLFGGMGGVVVWWNVGGGFEREKLGSFILFFPRSTRLYVVIPQCMRNVMKLPVRTASSRLFFFFWLRFPAVTEGEAHAEGRKPRVMLCGVCIVSTPSSVSKEASQCDGIYMACTLSQPARREDAVLQSCSLAFFFFLDFHRLWFLPGIVHFPTSYLHRDGTFTGMVLPRHPSFHSIVPFLDSCFRA